MENKQNKNQSVVRMRKDRIMKQEDGFVEYDQENDRYNPIANRNYYRPRANHVFDNPHVEGFGDFVFDRNYKGYVLSKNLQDLVPEPSKRRFGLTDVSALMPNDRIFIETVNQAFELATIEKITRRTVELKQNMTVSPRMGGVVYKVVGQSTDLIDTRYDLDKESDRNAFKQFEQQAKQNRLEQVRKHLNKNK